MNCPFCDNHDTKVLDTRSTDEGKSIRRRRECLSCNKRFTTYEKIENIPLIIVKKDGSRDIFEPNKVLKGLMTACKKRPVTLEQMQSLVAHIEKELRGDLEKEVSSTKVGEIIMNKLKELDQVAYVRFASVYREFKDVDTFVKEIEQM